MFGSKGGTSGQVNAFGTKRSRTETSVLSVPRIPSPCQVSSTSTSFAGMMATMSTGIPCAMRGSIAVHHETGQQIQRDACEKLARARWPVNR